MATPAEPVEVVQPSSTTIERSPVDVLRTVVAGVVMVVLVLVGWLAGDNLTRFFGDLLVGFDAVPRWLATSVVVAFRIAYTLAFFGGIIAAVVTRRFRLLGTVALAVVVAVALVAAADPIEAPDPERALELHDDALGPLSEEEYPTSEGVAVVAAAATAAAPWLDRRWRRVGWALVVGATVSRFLSAPVSFDTVYALSFGWFTGSATLVLLGSPVRRPTPASVSAGLGEVGIEVTQLDKAGVDARGSTPYFGVRADGEKLFVKALGADERSADLLFRAWRRVLPHDLGDERAFSTLRRTVEHEALVALAAADVGVRTPPLVGFATCEPDGFVLAYQAIAGRSLDGVAPDRLSDDVLTGVWQEVARLRAHRIAHRDLRLANVFLDDDDEVWIIDFGFSELAASDLLLANDLAELLASLSLAVGPERAVAAGLAVLAPAELATAADRLAPFALSGATRTGMKERSGLLDDLRSEVAALAPAGQPGSSLAS